MPNVIKEKSFQFAVRIARLSKLIQFRRREYVLSNQLLRSGTAIGALVREAQYAESRADFVHKLSIALKEANETAYWLEVMHEAELLSTQTFSGLQPAIAELIRLLTAIINSTKKSCIRR